MGTDEGFTSGAFMKMLRAVANDSTVIRASFFALTPAAATPSLPMKCSGKSDCCTRRNRWWFRSLDYAASAVTTWPCRATP